MNNINRIFARTVAALVLVTASVFGLTGEAQAAGPYYYEAGAG